MQAQLSKNEGLCPAESQGSRQWDYPVGGSSLIVALYPLFLMSVRHREEGSDGVISQPLLPADEEDFP